LQSKIIFINTDVEIFFKSNQNMKYLCSPAEIGLECSLKNQKGGIL